jgi:REP element-mobilizing transposase RayT
MVRGIERAVLFRDDADRADLLARLAALAEGGAVMVSAWALLPNHAHVSLRPGGRALARSMRALLTGYAGAFNRRHQRSGHLFQNRYKSIVVEEEPYLFELVRYLHLNPLRAQVIPDLRGLDRSPWTGHSARLETVPRPWQETATILAQFGPTGVRARKAYRAFVAAGVPRAGGQRCRVGVSCAVRAGGPRWGRCGGRKRPSPEMPGSWAEANSSSASGARPRRPSGCNPPRPTLESVIARVCRHTATTPEEVAGGGRRPAVTHAREGIAHLWVGALGQSGRRLAPLLGVAPQSVYRAAARGAAGAVEWTPLLRR